MVCLVIIYYNQRCLQVYLYITREENFVCGYHLSVYIYIYLIAV